MLNRIFVVDSVTLTSTGTAVSTYTPWDQTTRKLPTQVVVKATGQGAYVRLSNDNSAATNADVLVQAGDHVVLSVQGRRWVSVLSDGASSTVNVGALSTGVSGSAASLDLAFVDAGVLDPRVTFTRASTGTYFDSAGVLTSAAINAPRFDYNPATLAAQGLLIEEQRTNSIRNNTMQGAVAGTPGTVPTNWGVSGLGTLTQQVVGTGTVNGITYIDLRFSGTTSTTQLGIRFEPSAIIAAANGQTWTGSTWCAVTAGSTTNITGNGYNANIYDSGSVFLASIMLGAVNTTSTLTRTTHSGTIVSATAAFIQPQIYLTFNSGVAIDITLRIGLPQLEQGAFATSVIPTTTTALTRSADVASVNTLSPWFNSVEGTFVASGQMLSVAGAASRSLFDASDGGASNRISGRLLTASVTDQATVRSGGSTIFQISSANATTTAIKNFALAYKASDFAVTSNGSAPITQASGAVPVGINQLQIGQLTGNAELLCGYLRRLTYYPRRLSNAELQAITV